MKVRLVSYSQPPADDEIWEETPTLQDLVAFCARVSNPSNQMNLETAEKLVRYLAKNKHWSPMEMVSVCLEIETTRDIARQLLRHRSFSFQEFCLSGDTEIYFALPDQHERGNYVPTKKMKLSDLYGGWEHDDHTPMKDRISDMLIKCYDEETQKLTVTNIKEVFYTGKKELYEITLSDGKKIKTTKEHKFLTKDGFDDLENIVGLERKGDRAFMTKHGVIGVNGIPEYQENAMIPTWVEIVSIEYVGVEDTYDIEVDHGSHNYVANGIIAHNSQRYADPTKELEFVTREARLQDSDNRQNSIPTDDNALKQIWDTWQRNVCDQALVAYQWAIDNGIAKEQARVVLPEGLTMSRLYVNGTLRSWIHYVELRSANGTQLEHIELAKACAKVIAKLFPSMNEYVEKDIT